MASLLTADGDCVGEDDGVVVGEDEGEIVGVGEGDGEAVGDGDGVTSRVAVIVPGPVIVAVVEVCEYEPISSLEPAHEEKVYPFAGKTVIVIVPAFSQTFVPEGLVVPAPEGLTVKFTKY